MGRVHLLRKDKRNAAMVVPAQAGRVRVLVRHLRPEPRLIVAPLLPRRFAERLLLVIPVAAMLVGDEVMVSVGIVDGIVMVLSNRRSVVARISHRPGLLNGIGTGRNMPVPKQPVSPGTHPRKQRAARRCAGGRAGIGGLKAYSFLGQTVQIWSANMRIAIRSHAIDPPLIGHQ